MYEVIGAIVDNGEFLEVQRDFAKNIIVGFGPIQRTVSGYCSQPAEVPRQVYSTVMHRVKERVSFVSVMLSIFQSFRWLTCRDSFRVPDKNIMQ